MRWLAANIATIVAAAGISAAASGFGGINVRVTYYHPVTWQTDASPHIASCGPIKDAPAKSFERIVALSRDLFWKRAGKPGWFTKRCGERIVIVLDGGAIIRGVVWDTMNARFRRTVDVLYEPGERPRWGATRGKLFHLEEWLEYTAE